MASYKLDFCAERQHIILQLLFIFCLWTLGDSMESYLGSFRMNVYFSEAFCCMI